MGLSVPWNGSLKTYSLFQQFGPTGFSAEPAGYGYNHFHRGVDFELPCGTELIAPADGTVSFAGWDNTGYGNKVAVQHSDGTTSFCAHMSRVDVTVGEGVYRGQHLGLSGTTGNSTGCHLHFGVMIGDLDVNPLDYIDGGSVYNTSPDNFAGGIAHYSTVRPGGNSTNVGLSPTPSPIVTYKDVIVWARTAGLPVNSLAMAAAIAMAESRLDTTATNKNGPTQGCPFGSTDYGLWQINTCYHPQYNSDQLLSDPQYNADAMADISNKGTDWSAWSTYKNGLQKPYLGDANKALADLIASNWNYAPSSSYYASGSGDIQLADVTNESLGITLDDVSVTPNLSYTQYNIAPVRVNSSGLVTFPHDEAVMVAWIHEGYIALDSGDVQITTYFKPGSFSCNTTVEWLDRVANKTVFNALLERRPTQIVVLAGYVEDTLSNWSAQQLVPIFTGLLETPDFDYNTTDTGPEDVYALTGPDLSGIFSAQSATMDNPTQFDNKKIPAAVKALISRHNPKGANALKAVVADTPLMAGDAFGTNSTATVTKQTTEWDFLQSLAASAGFVCYMDGTTLRFMPVPPPTDPLILEYRMKNKAATRVTRVRVRPQPHSKRDYKITLTSYNTDQQKTLRSTAGNAGSSNGITIPQTANIGKSKLDSLAKATLQKYVATEILVEITIQGIVRIGLGQPVHIHSDRIPDVFTRVPYYPIAATYSYQQGDGLSMVISCTNRPWGIQTTEALGGDSLFGGF